MLTKKEALNLLKGGCECMHITETPRAICTFHASEIMALLNDKPIKIAIGEDELRKLLGGEVIKTDQYEILIRDIGYDRIMEIIVDNMRVN